MAKRRHPARYIYLYSTPNPWWTAVFKLLEVETEKLNQARLGVLQEHWFARVGPQIPALRRQVRTTAAVLCVSPDRWTPDLEKTAISRVMPVHIVARAITQEQRLRAEALGWAVWLMPQTKPGQLVQAILKYCY
jgi:hypothetical protein